MGMNLGETEYIGTPASRTELPIELVADTLSLREKKLQQALYSIDNRMDFSPFPGSGGIEGNVTKITIDIAKSISRLEKTVGKGKILSTSQLKKLQTLLRGSLVGESVWGEQNENSYLHSISKADIGKVKQKVMREVRAMLGVK